MTVVPTDSSLTLWEERSRWECCTTDAPTELFLEGKKNISIPKVITVEALWLWFVHCENVVVQEGVKIQFT